MHTKTRRDVERIHLDLCLFMKTGPSFKNSLVSPKNGQPMVPGGNPFLPSVISFHFDRNRKKNMPINIKEIAMIKSSIDAPKKSSETQLRD